MKDGKNGKPHVLTLQDLQDDSLQFDLSAEPLEELFIWYQAAWDITQREISKEYHRQHEVSKRSKPVQRYWFWAGARTIKLTSGYIHTHTHTHCTTTSEGSAVLGFIDPEVNSFLSDLR